MLKKESVIVLPTPWLGFHILSRYFNGKKRMKISVTMDNVDEAIASAPSFTQWRSPGAHRDKTQ
jgi:hypothetical protein